MHFSFYPSNKKLAKLLPPFKKMLKQKSLDEAKLLAA